MQCPLTEFLPCIRIAILSFNSRKMCNKIPSSFSGSALSEPTVAVVTATPTGSQARCKERREPADQSAEESDDSTREAQFISPQANGQDHSSGSPASQMGDDNAPFTSVGGIGHPNLCRRPCQFMAMGHCHHGQNCKKCHEHHGLLQCLLNRKQRASLRELNEAQVWRLLWPYIQAQVRNWELSADPMPVLHLADRRFEYLMLSGVDPKVPPRAAHELSTVLRSMNFGSLMDIALGRLDACDQRAGQASSSKSSEASLWLDGVRPEHQG